MKSLFVVLSALALAVTAMASLAWLETSQVRDNAAAALRDCGEGHVARVDQEGYLCQ